MPKRHVSIPDIGEVVLSKNRRNRNLRLSVSSSGKIRVSMPYWTPFSAGIGFIKAHQTWLSQQLVSVRPVSPAKDAALRQLANQNLPLRVQQLSQQHGLPFNNLRIKKMTSRWGSCSSKGNVSLSYYLLQLPPQLIDYVIVHELAHTKYPNHSLAFWRFMEERLPNVHQLRRQIRAYKASVEVD